MLSRDGTQVPLFPLFPLLPVVPFFLALALLSRSFSLWPGCPVLSRFGPLPGLSRSFLALARFPGCHVPFSRIVSASLDPFFDETGRNRSPGHHAGSADLWGLCSLTRLLVIRKSSKKIRHLQVFARYLTSRRCLSPPHAVAIPPSRRFTLCPPCLSSCAVTKRRGSFVVFIFFCNFAAAKYNVTTKGMKK